ncbi:MAG TPA: SGNH/GDSL hydrolase family protein [Vicinamibacterales bacterium]|nr:SGNH/GDSL hydrolase family protein [Vicinamibacterales bacterium]
MSLITKMVTSIVVFVLFVSAIEAGARVIERDRASEPNVGLLQEMRPYLMSTSQSGGGFKWLNVLDHNRVVPSTIVFNNYGYAENFDYSMIPSADYVSRHGKHAGEKLVLLTGGSVVHGVGATANDKTIARRMQNYLNDKSATHWRVINMAMGGWIAYQQFLGLAVFGAPLNPDWVVSMDGHNDATVPCAHGSGAGNPLGWPQIVYMEQGSMGGGERNGFLSRLAKYSAAVRVIGHVDPVSRDMPIPSTLVRDNDDPDPRFAIKMAHLDVSSQEKQVDFYLQAERNIVALFSHANILMSTQPVMFDNAVTKTYRKAFSPKADPVLLTDLERADDAYMDAYHAQRCSSTLAPGLLGYFLGKSAVRLEAMMSAAQAADPSRRLLYYNTESAMPLDPETRRPFFIDNAHMSDLGQDRIGEFLADVVLSSERGESFDYQGFVQRHEN